jgi:hypothetical protein
MTLPPLHEVNAVDYTQSCKLSKSCGVEGNTKICLFTYPSKLVYVWETAANLNEPCACNPSSPAVAPQHVLPRVLGRALRLERLSPQEVGRRRVAVEHQLVEPPAVLAASETYYKN